MHERTLRPPLFDLCSTFVLLPHTPLPRLHCCSFFIPSALTTTTLSCHTVFAHYYTLLCSHSHSTPFVPTIMTGSRRERPYYIQKSEVQAIEDALLQADDGITLHVWLDDNGEGEVRCCRRALSYVVGDYYSPDFVRAWELWCEANNPGRPVREVVVVSPHHVKDDGAQPVDTSPSPTTAHSAVEEYSAARPRLDDSRPPPCDTASSEGTPCGTPAAITPIVGHACVICQARPDELLAEPLPCGCTRFHASCLATWSAISSRCPICSHDSNPHPTAAADEDEKSDDNECSTCGQDEYPQDACCGCVRCAYCLQQQSNDEEDQCPKCGEDMARWLQAHYPPNYDNSRSAKIKRRRIVEEAEADEAKRDGEKAFIEWYKWRFASTAGELDDGSLPCTLLNDRERDTTLDTLDEERLVEVWALLERDEDFVMDEPVFNHVFQNLGRLRRYAVLEWQMYEADVENEERGQRTRRAER